MNEIEQRNERDEYRKWHEWDPALRDEDEELAYEEYLDEIREQRSGRSA